jgi:hypothetical protein
MNAIFLNEETIRRAAKKILGLTVLASFALIFAGPLSAQAKPLQTDSTAANSGAAAPGTTHNTQSLSAALSMDTATAQAAPEKSKQPVAENSSDKALQPKGQHEGITVHGHWIVEVKNPDGKIVSHTEFENALSPGFSFPAPAGRFTVSTVPVPGGAAFLSGIMSGQAVITPENWAILLEGPNGLQGTGGAPCTSVNSGTPYATCFLFPTATDSNFLGGPDCLGGAPAGPGYACNLTVTPVGTAPNFSGFQLSGSIAATQNGTVSNVATMNFGVCGATDSLPSCAFAGSVGWAALTARPLDGNTPAGAAAGDPNPVPVTSGQTIAVTVTISFQ